MTFNADIRDMQPAVFERQFQGDGGWPRFSAIDRREGLGFSESVYRSLAACCGREGAGMNHQVFLHFLDLVDGSVAASIARSFGINLDNLRIQLSSEVAVAFGARAFAYSDQIHFAPGEFDRSTAEGWRTIGHELAHVVQQRPGRVPQTAGIIDDPELEREAHAAGDLAASVFATGRAPATSFYPGPIPVKAHRCPSSA
jgi:hypothetical protein